MKRLFALGALCLAGAATAHGPDNTNIPVLRCWSAVADVVCASGWSRNSPMRHAVLDVIGPDGKTIATLKTDAKGRARFARPQGGFAVLLHDVRGNGQTVEVNPHDVDATGPPP